MAPVAEVGTGTVSGVPHNYYYDQSDLTILYTPWLPQ